MTFMPDDIEEHRQKIIVGVRVAQLSEGASAAQTRYYHQVRANILHLLDLKRAGHSPTRTEFVIPSDFRPVPAFTEDGRDWL